MKGLFKALLASSCLGLAVSAGTGTRVSPPIPTQSLTNSSSPQVNFQLSTDSEFAFVLEIFLSMSNGGGANTGEILRAASQIVPGDFESFYTEFKFLADSIYQGGLALDSHKYPISVRDAMFRAATYYRASDFFLHGNQSDPRIYSLWDSQTDAFNRAIALLPNPGKRYNISTSHGYYVPIVFYKASNSNARTPTIVIGNGYDAAQEDSYHSFCPHVLARGWNCVTYEGPGQPSVRRDQNKGFIPDWWNVVTPVVDFLEKRSDVDTRRMALLGISFGGLLAPLAASREHRFKAVISIDGVFNLGLQVQSEFPPQVLAIYNAGNKTTFDAIINQVRLDPTTNTGIRWGIDQGMFAFDTESPYEWLQEFSNITMLNATSLVTTPVYVGEGEDDDVAPGQAEQLANALGSKAYYNFFRTDVGAGEHCQIGAEMALAASVFDWTASVFG